MFSKGTGIRRGAYTTSLSFSTNIENSFGRQPYTHAQIGGQSHAHSIPGDSI